MTDEAERNKEEREFLHTLATPIGAAVFLAESLLEDLQNKTDADPDDVDRINGLVQSLEKVKTLMQERRSCLVAKGGSGARS